MTARLRDALAGGIRAERSRTGFTQAELAARLGWSTTRLASIERGERSLPADDLADVCLALGVSLARLLAAAHADDRAALGT